MVELSKAMGQTQVADLLAATLAEEKAQDEPLTEMTRGALLPTVLSMSGETEKSQEEGSARSRSR